MQLNYWLYCNYTGYSISAQDYILAALRTDPSLNIKVNYLNKVPSNGVSKNKVQFFHSLKVKENVKPQVNLYHCIPHLYRRPEFANKHIGFCIFETINPPEGWIKKMNEMDEIITASMFNKRIFEQAGATKPITVIPHCFDTELFNKDVVPTGRYGKMTFFSIGTWKNRKNWEMLIKAFYDGFEKKDNVCLLIKTDKPDSLQSLVTRVKRQCEWRSKDTAPIYSEENHMCNFEDIPKIMKKGDIYISASLGEGFNLGGLHAMALGLPVITVRFGGSLEYALPNLCTYIEPKSYKTYNTMDGIPQFNNCIWPVLRISDVRDAMRKVYDNYPTESKNAAYKHVHENFSYEAIGPKLIEAVAKGMN